MNEDNPNKGCHDYKVNLDQSDLINIYIRQWVLLWCKKYHPEAFEEAEKYILSKLKEIKAKKS